MYQTIDEVLTEVAEQRNATIDLGGESLAKLVAEQQAQADKWIVSPNFLMLCEVAKITSLMGNVNSGFLNVALVAFEAGRLWGRSEVLEEMGKK